MLKKNLSKSALVVALLTTTVIWRGTTAYAEDPNQAFTLDPMIVTAQRTETRLKKATSATFLFWMLIMFIFSQVIMTVVLRIW